MPGSTTGWGVLSSAQIGRKALIPAIAAAGNARLVCLGTPNAERVRESAAAHGYRVLPDYAAVLADPEVQVVYNPLPNGLHAEWTIRALEAGKHVLCEKPIAVTAGEAAEMAAASRRTGRLLMEAFMYRFHPQIALARQALAEGRIGPLRTIRACFTFNLAPDLANPRFQPDQGPGALLDVGCYCVNAIRTFSGGLPEAVTAWANWNDAIGGDMTTTGLLEYPEHAALFDCSFEAAGRSGLELVGSEGRIELPKPWLPGKDPAVVRVLRGNEVEELRTEGVDQYRLMVEHFSDCAARGEQPAYPPADAVENMRVLDAIRTSAREHRRVTMDEV